MITLVKFLITPLLGIGAIFLGGNIVAERLAESRISAAVARQLDLKTTPEVDIGGFPVLLDLFWKKRLSSIDVTARDITIEGLGVSEARMELRDITSGDFLSGDYSVRVGAGTATADVTETAVNRYLTQRKAGVTMDFAPDGATARASRVYNGRRRQLLARGRIEIRRSLLVFVPTSIAIDGREASGALRERARRDLSISVRMPDLPGGIRPTRVTLKPDAVELGATLKDTRIAFG